MPMVMTTTWMMEGLGTHITGSFNTFSSSAPQYYQFKGTKKRSRNIFQAASVAAALNATCQSTERASCTLYGVFRLDGSSERPAAYWQSPCTKRNMHQVVAKLLCCAHFHKAILTQTLFSLLPRITRAQIFSTYAMEFHRARL